MATDVSQLGYSTFIDVVNNYSSTDANASLVNAARVLDRQCPLLSILPMQASNNVLSNVAVRTDSLPVPGTRRFNEGVSTTAAHNTQITDPMAMWEDYSDTDMELCNIQNNPTAWRMDQDASHMEGLPARTWSPPLFTAPWRSTPAASTAWRPGSTTSNHTPTATSQWVPNVWNGGQASGNATSIWAIEFGPKKVTGLYPANTAAGLMVRDLGKQTKEYFTALSNQGASKKLQVYTTHLKWWMGIQVEDERCVQRIANINPTGFSGPNGFDENQLIEALTYLPGGGDDPSTVILVNRGMKAQIDIRASRRRSTGTTRRTWRPATSGASA